MAVSEAKQNKMSGNNLNHFIELASAEWLDTDIFLITLIHVKPRHFYLETKKEREILQRDVREDHTKTMITTNHKERQTFVPDCCWQSTSNCYSLHLLLLLPLS